jgi:hypothetical protein
LLGWAIWALVDDRVPVNPIYASVLIGICAVGAVVTGLFSLLKEPERLDTSLGGCLGCAGTFIATGLLALWANPIIASLSSGLGLASAALLIGFIIAVTVAVALARSSSSVNDFTRVVVVIFACSLVGVVVLLLVGGAAYYLGTLLGLSERATSVIATFSAVVLGGFITLILGYGLFALMNPWPRLQKQFWDQLLEQSNQRTPLFASESPATRSVISVNQAGIEFCYVTRAGQCEVTIGASWRAGGEERRKEIVKTLLKERQRIENAFEGELEWPDRVSTYGKIRHIIPDGGLNDIERWPLLQAKMIDAMTRLYPAVSLIFPELEEG